MTSLPRSPLLLALLVTLSAGAWASDPLPSVRRDGNHPVPPPAAAPASTTAPAVRIPAPPANGSVQAPVVVTAPAIDQQPLAEDTSDTPKPQIRRGTGQTINRGVAANPPVVVGSSGTAAFNFQNESIAVVVDAVLGQMLGQNYVIAPGVQGSITLATPRPISSAEALRMLEQALSWNGARMIYSDGRYNIVPAETAAATGTVVTSSAPAASARGFESRVMALRYISATEMEKILKPQSRPGSIVSVDNGRNVITVAGSRAELENYERLVRIFDVDWMASMSVGVYPLQSSRAAKVVSDLEKVFGEQSKSPVAGMFRFLPLEGSNAVMVITAQPSYLDDIEPWISRIDGAGEGATLHTYELKYITAKDLAQRLAQVFGASASGDPMGADAQTSLMPGLQSTTIDDGGLAGKEGIAAAALSGADGGQLAGDGSSGGGLGSGSMGLGSREGGNTSVTLQVDGDKVGVSAVDETNSLLVRASPAAWRSIKEVIAKLDVMPMQVHIEAQVAEVTLTGDLAYGVSWYFGQALNDIGAPDTSALNGWSSIGGTIRNLVTTSTGTTGGLAWTFARRNAAAIIGALDSISDVKILQSPSIMVRNNFEATLNVGSRIPINSVNVNTGNGGDSTYSQVQYLDTGTILKVRPRVTKDGTVFLDIVQEVSSPGTTADVNGNVRVNTRRMKTNAIVQSGDTVMLAGLISDEVSRGSSGFPGLSRIPLIGGLFGQQTSNKARTEVVIMITPTLLRDTAAARDLTDEYGRRFRALEPLRSERRSR